MTLKSYVTLIMYQFIVFNNIVEIHGDNNLNVILNEISKKDEWKYKFNQIISTGWHISDNKQIHYIKREAYSLLVALLVTNYNVTILIRHATPSEHTPLDIFEEWSPPSIYEASITYGYSNIPNDYVFKIPYYSKNPFGAWRIYSPAI